MNFCLWVTGLPGSGKSTIVNEIEQMLLGSDIEVIILNLDSIRKILTPKPRYTDGERILVYRSLVIMAKLLVEKGKKNVVIDATGNRKKFRELARNLIEEFAEVYVKCSLATCQVREAARGNKLVQEGLYKMAKEGQLKGQLPGVSVPYEESENHELQVDSDCMSPHESARRIILYIKSRWLR